MLSRILIWLICLGCVESLIAQDRYMVFFSDKANSDYSVSSPLEFLSQKALDRRSKHDVSVTEQDFPVNKEYLTALKNSGAQVYFTSRWMNAALVEMETSVVTAIMELPMVSAIEMVAPGSQLSYDKEEFSIADVFSTPTNSYTTDTQIEMLGADQMHTDGYTGEGILIAVLDGGFVGVNTSAGFEHLHSGDKIIAGLDFVKNSGNPYRDVTDQPNVPEDHGTRVLACIGGKYITQYTGTAPDASFILAITEEVDTEYRVEEYNWLLAAEFADSAGADVINSSVGYTYFDDPSMDYAYPQDFDGYTTVIARAANLASEKGILVVNSAGNSGNNSWHYINSPSDSRGVFSVGSVDFEETRSSFSSYGPSGDGRTKPDIAAMGSSTIVIDKTGEIRPSSGTSFSSPVMAGFVAGLIQKFPLLTNGEIIRIVKASASQYQNPDNSLGYGIPDYTKVFEENISLNIENYENSIFSIYPNPLTSNTLTINGPNYGKAIVTIIDIEGKVIQEEHLSLGDKTLELEAFMPPGIYFLRLQSGSTIETFKLLKR